MPVFRKRNAPKNKWVSAEQGLYGNTFLTNLSVTHTGSLLCVKALTFGRDLLIQDLFSVDFSHHTALSLTPCSGLNNHVETIMWLLKNSASKRSWEGRGEDIVP